MDSYVNGMQEPVSQTQVNQQQSPAVSHTSWNLAIFNNIVRDTDKIGSIEYDALQALSAHCSPIIIRKSVLSTIGQYLITIAENSSSPIPVLNRIAIILNDWHIFNTNKGDFCVLVPFQENTNPAEVTRLARELGLLVEEGSYGGTLNLSIVNNTFPFNNVCSAKDVAELVMDSSADHHWNIYLSGHGSEAYISDFLINEFRNFLLFLNTRKVNALVYGTCCGAGKNLQEPYTQNKMPLDLNYAIACQCARFADAVSNRNLDFEQLCHELDNRASYHSWDECFQAAFRDNKNHRGSYEYGALESELHMAVNFPWIRDPDAETFHLLSLPLYNAQRYCNEDDHDQGRNLVLTPQLHSLLVHAPCVNRPIIAQYFPAIISVADKAYHFFQSFTHTRSSLDQLPFAVFDSPSGEGQSTYLLGECRCMRDGRLYTYRNVRIQNKPVCFWPKFIHFMKYGKNIPLPKLSKIITAECEDGKIIQSIGNQQYGCNINLDKMVKPVCISLGLVLAGLNSHLIAANNVGIISKVTKILGKISYGLAIMHLLHCWLKSDHVETFSERLNWLDLTSWKTLSPTEAQNYRNEFNRQHQELIDLK